MCTTPLSWMAKRAPVAASVALIVAPPVPAPQKSQGDKANQNCQVLVSAPAQNANPRLCWNWSDSREGWCMTENPCHTPSSTSPSGLSATKSAQLAAGGLPCEAPVFCWNRW